MTGNGVASNHSSNLSTYSKVLPVSVRKEVSNGGFQSSSSLDSPTGNGSQSLMSSCSTEQREMIRITISYPTASYGNMHPQKEITIRLTNDENPLFYYHLRIPESEFPTLKQQQGLLVDFLGFPAQLVSLLDKCDPTGGNGVESEENSGLRATYSGTNGPKFVLVIKISALGGTVLDIVESNPFKYLCHISLQISPGSDGEVKKYLCDMTTAIKKDYKILQEKYTHLSTTMEADLRRVNAMYESKCTEVNQLREEVHQQTSQMTTKHFQELSSEKEKLFKLQNDLVARCDAEKAEQERQHTQAVQKLQARITALEAEVQNANQVKVNQESALQDATNRLRVCGEEMTKFQQELSNLRQQNTRLDYDYHQMRLSKMEYQREVQNLEKEVQKNQDIIKKQNDSIISLSCDKKHLEEQRQELMKELELLRSSSKSTGAELQKANEIIKKFQDDIRSCHGKNKQLTATISEQDIKLEECEDRVEELKKEVSTLKEQLASAEKSLTEKTDELKTTTDKIKEQDDKLSSNENMIAWLNKQLNELQGLSDLNKFRANLNSSDRNDGRSSKNKENDAPVAAAVDDRMHNVPRPPLSRTLTEAPNGHVGSGRQPGMNTFSGASPSWLHIYQSTGNNSDHDLSSRLEHVSALGAILNSQSQLSKSARHDDSEYVDHNASGQAAKKTANQNQKTNLNTGKPPSWAKPKPKVTLDNLINKPTFPLWKNK